MIVPAREERARIASALSSLEALRVAAPYGVIAVVAGEDGTRSVARSFDGVRVVEGTGRGGGVDRNRGAAAAAGEYLAFVGADTVVRPDYLAAMTSFVERRDLAGATSRFRFHDAGSPRPRFVRRVADARSDRVRNPCLPGFNAVVSADDFCAVGGFPDAPTRTSVSPSASASGDRPPSTPHHWSSRRRGGSSASAWSESPPTTSTRNCAGGADAGRRSPPRTRAATTIRRPSVPGVWTTPRPS
ncbi:hypothetical protein BRC94_03165 [Halobacteriales archaeon QS_5_70_17]|nr:MAG: hypothetical protein BRC94_03165 [Halobacteriales archaeon QS_5_70_17]